MTYTRSLCYQRHVIRGSESMIGIFPTDIPDVRNVQMLERIAEEHIPQDCTKLNLFVSGCQAALLAVVAVCIRRNISLTAVHGSRTSSRLVGQKVM